MSATCRGKQTQCRLPTKRSFVSSPLPHEKRQPFRIVFFLVRTTGLVVSGASVIAERANLFAEVKRQLHSVQGQTNAVPFADKT